MVLLLAYMTLGSCYSAVARRWSMSRAVYFTFITTSTVGLGDMTLGWDSMQQVVLGIVVVMPGLVVFTLFTSLGAEWSARTAKAAHKRGVQALEKPNHSHRHATKTHREHSSTEDGGSSAAAARQPSPGDGAQEGSLPRDSRRDASHSDSMLAPAATRGGSKAKVHPDDPPQGEAHASSHTQVEDIQGAATVDVPGTNGASSDR